MSVPRGLYESYYAPPNARTSEQDRPTLLVTWWCTSCCIVLVFMRIIGRYVRVSQLYRDDKFMALTLIPLLVHQAFTHVVLLFGTNNVSGTETMDHEELRRRRIGSGMVLGARVTYTAFLWSQKFCITEFYVRLTHHFWERSYEVGLRTIQWSLLVTFLASVVSIFADCRPAYKLWQVQPDPGPKCRSAFAPLITISTLSIVTDSFLVLYPIPAIVRSSFTTLKKARLILTVFCLPLISIAFASYRITAVLRTHGSQQLRSLLAAFEILTATIIANAVVINSFARDKGAKKRKFSGESGVEDAEAGKIRMAYWGSDDDLARNLGMGRVPGISAERLQRGYGFSEHEREDMIWNSGEDRAVMHGAISPTTRPDSWELKDLGHDAPITPPPSPKHENDDTVLFDVGGLLRSDEHHDAGIKSSDDDGYDGLSHASVSSSSVGLRDIVGERDRKIRR